jgi:hypothetical protein
VACSVYVVAKKGTIGNIATLQPRCDIPLFSHDGCSVAIFNIYYFFWSWLLFIYWENATTA